MYIKDYDWRFNKQVQHPSNMIPLHVLRYSFRIYAQYINFIVKNPTFCRQTNNKIIKAIRD
jgi:hypothetical protein